MPTLVEELKRVENNQQKTEELKRAINEFVIQPNTIDILKKAALNGLSATVNGGFTRLEAKNYEPRWNRMGQPEQVKPMLTAHIDLLTDGASLYIEYYDSNQLTKEQVLQALKGIIGLEDK